MMEQSSDTPHKGHRNQSTMETSTKEEKTPKKVNFDTTLSPSTIAHSLEQLDLSCEEEWEDLLINGDVILHGDECNSGQEV